jgi:hypothetical protein
MEAVVKLFKKKQHYLFIEEESYKWAPRKSALNRHLITVSLLCLMAAFLFSTLR